MNQRHTLIEGTIERRRRAVTMARGEPACPVCGGMESLEEPVLTRIVRAQGSARLMRCKQCGLVWRNPPLSLEQAAAVYNRDYYRQYESTVGMTAEVDGKVRPHIARRVAAVEARIGLGRMIEIGCGKGALLSFARDRGWDVVGVEISADAARIARARGLSVYVGPAETVLPLTEQADFVHMNHVLEHVADPVRVLQVVHGALKPNGIAIIEVPNEFGNLFFRLGRKVLSEQRLTYAVPSTHQYFFTPSTLQRVVEGQGLNTLRCRTVRWTIGDQSGAVGKAIRRPEGSGHPF